MKRREADASQRETPFPPAPLPVLTASRATLTVLTGVQAGRIVTIDGAPITIGKAAYADLAVDDVGLSARHVRVACTVEGAFYAEDLGSAHGTFRGQDRIGVTLLRDGDLLQLGPSLQLRFAVVAASADRQLGESSARDPLTHVFTRSYLEGWLLAELTRAQSSGGEVIVLLIDVDRLEVINAHLGHLAGDRALCTMAARILRVLDAEDVMARSGGDEFVVVAAGTATGEARRLAERVRRAVEGLRMCAGGHEVHLTASIGLASTGELAADQRSVAALLSLADARMHTAKASGRNRVCTMSERDPHLAK